MKSLTGSARTYQVNEFHLQVLSGGVLIPPRQVRHLPRSLAANLSMAPWPIALEPLLRRQVEADQHEDPVSLLPAGSQP